MRRKKQNPNQIQLGYWWHFFLTFLFGVFLVFAFSFLISLTNTNPLPECPEGLIDKIREALKAGNKNEDLLNECRTKIPWLPILDPKYISLTIAGALGGLLYSILLDGSLELPGWGKNGKSLSIGSIGEIFVGIAGAFTTYIFIPQELKNSTDKEIIIFVFGLVGGYGGKAILDAALKKIIGRIEEADLVKEEKERLTQQHSDQEALITLVSKQLEQGLSASDIDQLSELIKNAPEDLKQRVFTRAKEIRSLSGQTKTARDKITLTIPIFQALVDTDPKNYEYKIQLAYALKDSEPPRLDQSISLLDEVIKLRGNRIVGDNWKVELNRALARIMQEQQQTGKNTNSSPWKEQILADLLIVDRNYGLPKVLLESEDEIVDIPLKDWLVRNKEWIKQNSGGADLLQKAFNIALGITTQSSGVTESGVLVATAGSRPSINDLKTSISSYVSTRSLRNGRSSTSVIETDHLKVAPPNTKIKAKTKTYLKKHPIDSSQLPSNQKTEVPAGKEYKVLKYSEEIDNHYLVELDYRLGIWYLWSDHWDLPWEEHRKVLSSVQGSAITKTTATQSSGHQSHDIVTRQQAQAVYGRTLTDQQFKDLNDCFHRFEINTVPRVRHFLSQTALESGGLRYMTEIWGPTPAQRTYEPPNRKAKELGNTNPGDGRKYRGGGVIQLTGRDNYQKFSKFINDPKVMDGADYVGATYPFSSAGFFWKNKNINALCDRGGTVEQVTFKVNGGYNGLPDRKRYYDKACQVIKQISAPSFVATVQPTAQSFGNVNIEQVKAQESAVKHTNPAVQRQIDRLTQYLPSGKTLNFELKTKYFSQRDNYRDQGRTCNSSSNAMYLDWLLRMIGKPGLNSDDEYLRKVFSIGDSPDHSVQTRAIKQYGFNTKWMTDRDTPFVEDLVETGFPVVVNILHHGPITNPSGGHVIMLIDRKDGDWITHDPWGTLKSGYKEHKGEYSRISEKEFNARWQGGYRTLA